MALLLLEGLLFLSERFGWFGFHERPGWAVLIAVAAAGGVILLLSLWFGASLLLRWRFQFSIGSLVVLMAAVAIACSWLAVEIERARKQQEAVDAINNTTSGLALYEHEWNALPAASRPPGPAWLRELLGDAFLARVDYVCLDVATDADLEQLNGIHELQSLDLRNSQVTDAGLQRLVELARFSFLDLSYTQVTDAGLRHLERLHELEQLHVSHTQVTDEGIKRLQDALPDCEIIDVRHVAYIGGIDDVAIDRIATQHVKNLLASKGIKSRLDGPDSALGWELLVPKHDAEAATRLLREDASKRPYYIVFPDGDYQMAAEPTRMVAGNSVGRVLALPQFAEHTPLGKFLRSRDLTAQCCANPIVFRLAVLRREYLATEHEIERVYEVEIELHRSADDNFGGFKGRFLVSAEGEVIDALQSTSWDPAPSASERAAEE